MSQKSSVPQAISFVSQVLKRDSFGGTGVAEIPGGSWHSVVFRAPGAVLLEIKSGAYEPQMDKEFANWAPKEADPLAAQFVRWLEVAAPGERVSSTFPSQ